MRTIAPAALARLNAETMRMALLVEMELSAPVYLSSANITLDFGGKSYIGTGVLGAVNEIDDSPGEYKNLTFSLSGVALDVIAIAMAENIQNKSVTLRLAVISEADYTVLDAPIIWTGTMDQMPISTDDNTAIVNVSAEHRGVTFARAKPINYNEVDQARVDPTDTCLRFVQSQSTHNDVWPAAEFFKQ